MCCNAMYVEDIGDHTNLLYVTLIGILYAVEFLSVLK